MSLRLQCQLQRSGAAEPIIFNPRRCDPQRSRAARVLFSTLANAIDLQRSGGARRRFPIPADAIGNVQAPLAQQFSVLTCAIRNVRAPYGRTFPPRADYMSAASTGAQRKSERIEQTSMVYARAQAARERGEDASVAGTGAWRGRERIEHGRKAGTRAQRARKAARARAQRARAHSEGASASEPRFVHIEHESTATA